LSLRKALENYERALQIDPDYALAHAGVAIVWGARYQFGMAERSEAVPFAKAAAEKAVELDDTLAEAHYALACIKAWSYWDWESAETGFLRALELNSNFPDLHAYYSHLLMHMGRTDEALPHMELALELDPFNPLFHGMYGIVMLSMRRFDEAITACRTALAIQPNHGTATAALQWTFIANGMDEEQLANQRARIALDPERVTAFERGLKEGGYEGAQRAIADLLASRHGKPGRWVFPAIGIGLRYFDAGDYEKAMDWYEKAYDKHDPSLPYIALPFHDPMRSNPRFQDLLRRIGLPVDQ
jgi:tetratricopeptide (TPR) repeat protein